MTSERGSEVEVSLRPFEPGDAPAVHRWFNNPRGDRVADGAARRVLARAGRGLGARGRWTTRGEDRKFAIVVEGYEEPVGFTALYGLFRQTAPELGALIGDDVARQGRRPPRRGADDRQGLRRVRRPPRLRAHPRPQRGREEDRRRARLAARGDDARAPPPPRRHRRRLRGLGRLGRRVPRALVGRRRPGELDRRGRADRRRRCGGRRDRRLLPLPRVPRRRGGHPHARRRRRLEPRLRPVARPPDPGDRRRDAISPYCYPGGAARGRPDRSGARSTSRLPGSSRVFLRHRLGEPPLHRRHRAQRRPGRRPGPAAQDAAQRPPPDPQERGGRLRDLASRPGPEATAADRAGFLTVYERDDARTSTPPTTTSSAPPTSDAARLTATWLVRWPAPAATAPPRPSPSAATASSTTTSRQRRRAPPRLADEERSSPRRVRRRAGPAAQPRRRGHPGDGLEEFKRGFANAELPYRTHELICDPGAYAELARGREDDGFFPLYRRR